MKRGQLLSQPFFYVFAIVIVGLIVVFGFRYVGKILKTGCEVEMIDLVSDVQSSVNELRALSYGSNYACTFTKASGTDYRCEFVVPSNINVVCFVGRGQENQIPEEFNSIRDFIFEFGSAADLNKNLFFSSVKGSSCEAEPVLIKNVEIDGPVCLDVTKENSFIMENSGRKVLITMS